MIIYIFVLHIILTSGIRILDKGILPLEKKSVGIQFFIDFENEDKTSTCHFRSWPQMCCLYDKDDEDCDIINVYGENSCILKPKERNTFFFVYPTIMQHDKFGYCNFVMYHQDKLKRKIRSDIIRIDFDTRLENMPDCLSDKYVSGLIKHNCKGPDEDPLNDCQPVNCELKYSGKRPFYDSEANRCVKAATCYWDGGYVLPNIIYDLNSNTCKDLNNFFLLPDVFALSTGIGVYNDSLFEESELPEIPIRTNCKSISQNLLLLKDLLYGKMKFEHCDFKNCFDKAIKSVMTCIVFVSLTLLLLAFCANMCVCLYDHWSKGKLDKDIANMKSKLKPKINKPYEGSVGVINKDIRDNLLKEIIVSELPIELRKSMDMSDAGRSMKPKNRYIETNITRFNCWRSSDTDTSTTSDVVIEEETQKLIK